MATTIQRVLDDLRRELNAAHRYEVSTLAVAAGLADTTLTLTYDLPPSLRVGATLSIGTEDMRVMQIAAPAKEVTVIRGWQGSVVATHDVGDEVRINPRFSAHDIFQALQDDLRGLPESLFRVVQTQVAVGVGVETLELPTEWRNLYGLIDARIRWIDPVNFYDTERTTWPRLKGRIVRGDPTVWTEGPSTGIYFRLMTRTRQYIDTSTISGHAYFTAALPFDFPDDIETSQDIVTEYGLQASMLDIVKMGVKIRLMPDEEIARSDRRGQDENRRASEVPPGTAVRPVNTLAALYYRRRQEEANRLRALYPIVMN